MKAPYPYFGGKRTVAELVWSRLGDVDNFIEPFFGSGAVLLNRPADFHGNETVNDLDAYVANFWRAMQNEPERLAEICDNPVNEVDLEAWHKWLVTAGRKAELAANCKDDPEYYDAVIAGRWCWGLCQWIGCGWCSGEWNGADGKNSGRGVNVRDLERGGKLPHFGDNGMGVHRQLPHLGNGMGVHRQLPHLGNNGMGVHPCSEWFSALCDRLRRVRVCCGDWKRVTGDSVTVLHGLTGVFLDPPYADTAKRTKDIYAQDCLQVAHEVREWAIANGHRMRICLAGYDGEHAMPDDWEVVEWKAHGGYANQSEEGSQGRENATKERLWFSPLCLRFEKQKLLF
jgi:site-specific DNA-adenine methylase